ncbi:hypothetical protein HPT27_09700 [Permianibacter sp. IMCC34836]|uniref:hypothetical protein n=1 Tax=Permianibacter fluminis TaxID=2738515 RepID=UPI001551F3AD|nr:hypothetical protein [Permianibacter fluminis]NQD37301.1 hypothetical protein [Permianibacter fluminis]
MLPLSASWRRLDNRFLALSQRERLMVIAMVLAIIAAAAEFLFFSTLREQITLEKNQQASTRQQREQLENELAQLQAWHASQEDAGQLNAVTAELQAVDDQIQQLSQRMVPPEQMTALLQQLLAREQGMQVVALEKLPLEQPVIAGTDAGTDADADAGTVVDPVTAAASKIDNAAHLYRHRLRLSLRGSYFDSLRYLQAMEALPWTVYWDSLDYQVEQYPLGIMTVEIATLGQEEGWLGG